MPQLMLSACAILVGGLLVGCSSSGPTPVAGTSASSAPAEQTTVAPTSAARTTSTTGEPVSQAPSRTPQESRLAHAVCAVEVSTGVFVEILGKNADYDKMLNELGDTEVVQIVESSRLFQTFLGDLPKFGQSASLRRLGRNAAQECSYGSTIGTPMPDPVLTKAQLNTLAQLLPPRYRGELNRITYFG